MNLERKSNVLAAAVQTGLFDAEPPLALFYDLDRFREGLRALSAAFPPGTLHAVAVKANPLGALLREALGLGFGAECASAAEMAHALAVGFAPDRVVFDSPAKTRGELERALSAGVLLNVDNFQELSRVAAFFADGRSDSVVGLRVNPGVGAGAIAATSTAIPTSKFGVPLDENRQQIVQAFRSFPWLRGLHVHVGSQGCPLELNAAGVRRVAELAADIESLVGRRVEILDVGGGLPVSYDAGARAPSFEEYARSISAAAPAAWAGRHRLITEVGRAVSASAGWAASRVEYTKISGGRRIAVIHAGADLFLRAAYLPEIWRHHVTVHDASGAPKDGPLEPWDIAGPLCFTGDLVARERPLPPIEPGDIVVVHDAGAYTLSTWSRYNSRRAPAVLGHEGEPPALHLLKAAESEESVLSFWR